MRLQELRVYSGGGGVLRGEGIATGCEAKWAQWD